MLAVLSKTVYEEEQAHKLLNTVTELDRTMDGVGIHAALLNETKYG